MNAMVLVAGLLAYALSLAIPGQQWYLALIGGLLTGLGITRIIRSFPRHDRQPEAQQPSSDAAIEAATLRVLQAAKNGNSWKVIELGSSPVQTLHTGTPSARAL